MRLDHVNEKPGYVEQSCKPRDNENNMYCFKIVGSHAAKVISPTSADNSFIIFIVLKFDHQREYGHGLMLLNSDQKEFYFLAFDR